MSDTALTTALRSPVENALSASVRRSVLVMTGASLAAAAIAGAVDPSLGLVPVAVLFGWTRLVGL